MNGCNSEDHTIVVVEEPAIVVISVVKFVHYLLARARVTVCIFRMQFHNKQKSLT